MTAVSLLEEDASEFEVLNSEQLRTLSRSCRNLAFNLENSLKSIETDGIPEGQEEDYRYLKSCAQRLYDWSSFYSRKARSLTIKIDLEVYRNDIVNSKDRLNETVKRLRNISVSFSILADAIDFFVNAIDILSGGGTIFEGVAGTLVAIDRLLSPTSE